MTDKEKELRQLIRQLEKALIACYSQIMDGIPNDKINEYKLRARSLAATAIADVRSFKEMEEMKRTSTIEETSSIDKMTCDGADDIPQGGDD